MGICLCPNGDSLNPICNMLDRLGADYFLFDNELNLFVSDAVVSVIDMNDHTATDEFYKLRQSNLFNANFHKIPAILIFDINDDHRRNALHSQGMPYTTPRLLALIRHELIDILMQCEDAMKYADDKIRKEMRYDIETQLNELGGY